MIKQIIALCLFLLLKQIFLRVAKSAPNIRQDNASEVDNILQAHMHCAAHTFNLIAIMDASKPWKIKVQNTLQVQL